MFAVLKILIVGLCAMAFSAFVAVATLDAYEYGITGDCRQCVLLPKLRPSLAYQYQLSPIEPSK